MSNIVTAPPFCKASSAPPFSKASSAPPFSKASSARALNQSPSAARLPSTSRFITPSSNASDKQLLLTSLMKTTSISHTSSHGTSLMTTRSISHNISHGTVAMATEVVNCRLGSTDQGNTITRNTKLTQLLRTGTSHSIDHVQVVCWKPAKFIKGTADFSINEQSFIACSWSKTFSRRPWTRLIQRFRNFPDRKWKKRGPGKSSISCEARDGENEKETGASSSTLTEEPENKAEATSSSPPASASPPSPPPEGGHRSGLKNVQLDAFKFMELVGPEKVDPEDVKLLKERVFGYTTFWVTGQEPFGDLGEGVLLLGNLRGQREEVFTKLQRSLRELTGNKYDLFMIEEPNSEESDPRGGPRVSFVLLRTEVSDPGPTTLWQYVIAGILFALTAGACLELGIATQISRLPPEVVRYFINPEVTEPPDVQLLLPYVESALPLSYGVFGVQLFHEVGHRLVAAPRKVKLGIPYLIPNITLGSFGAITQFKSICPDRAAKFDISMAGPFAGAVLSSAMLGVGLLLSTSPASSGDLIQIPSLVFQGSLLLGLISRGALGYDLMHAATVGVHPLTIAGWCGLTTTAFNLLPVGCLDGGRAMQAAFGKTALSVSGVITYLLLGLGVLGGPLSLPWGLYILIVQRSPEKLCLNDVTGVGPWRKAALALSLVLVGVTLLPLWDSLAEELGIGLASAPLL
ncbi:hypothetical protein O6H91_16G009200 [Diphasiastrum complanatum]|uniref:Uncharacterized protein n=1 Tax=Diphasiastrum complanatum TaxID=34168 RepID=A0ACC2B9S8_DIPCM|nr:hypothetical protein O6H91_16G009200 [Diphasiastrum complanatum]